MSDPIVMEQTLVILKPDAVLRGLTGEITARFERKGLQLVGLQMTEATIDKLERHYAEYYGYHIDEVPVKAQIFPLICRSMRAGPIIVQIWEGDNAVSVVRRMIGATDPSVAMPGTIRGDYAMSIGKNIIHASASVEDAQMEKEIWGVPIVTSHMHRGNLRNIYRC